MIPQKLELTNFLSYRQTETLDFTGIHLACISGANGAGKSTILDAITWSLFGRSRNRSDDEIINRLAAIQGDAAEVRFTFCLEKTNYRIFRRKGLGKSSILELQIAIGDDSWKTLSENKLRETQAAIEQLLKMSYDTFTNSSLLLQGKADEFTTRTPNQRKEILAILLGVTEWEYYRELAAEARKVDQGKFALLEGRIEENSTELGEENERKAALQEAHNYRNSIADKLKLQDQLLYQMRQTVSAVSHQETLVANLRKNEEQIRRNLTNSRNNYAKRLDERNAYHSIVADKETIETEFSDWQLAVVEAQNWQKKADAYHLFLQEKQPFDIQLAQEQSRLEQKQKQLEEQEQKAVEALSRRPELEKKIAFDEKRLAEIKTLLTELSIVQKELHQAREDLQQTTGERRLLQQELDQLHETERQIQQLETKKTTVNDNKIEAEKRIESLETELSDLTRQQDAYSQSKADFDSLQNQQPLLRQEMDKLKNRIDQLEKSDDASACPVCGQPLSEQHRQQVVQELTEEGKDRANLWRSNLNRLRDLEIELPKLLQRIKSKPQFERDLKAQQQRLAQADAQISEFNLRIQQWDESGKQRLLEIETLLADDTLFIKQKQHVNELELRLQPGDSFHEEQEHLQRAVSNSKAQLITLDQVIAHWNSDGNSQLNNIRKQLTEKAFAIEAREKIAALQNKINELDYDSILDQASREKRDALARAEVRYQELKRAEAAIKPLESTLHDLEQNIQEHLDMLEEVVEQLQTSVSHLEALKPGIVDLQKIEDQVTILREEEIAASNLVGRAEQRLAVLDNLRILNEQIEQEKTSVLMRIQRLKLLEKSCGRGGVQALLIEHALPEIEERANQLLDRLTGGDMSISFETQRKLKTRDDLSETLDIRIADKDGERPYENYSGGEQFRVNFAIRLALSQLLTKRAGARLQTLIIDEGFGSQDPQGRQRLVEAINAVRDEFACILVITHIDELRDAFPNRIEISKENDGSKISVF